MTADHRRVLNEATRRSFSVFVHRAFQTVCPGERYGPNWHIEAICWHLQQCRLGRIKRLIINMPPRSLKSIVASVAYPAWRLGHDPTARIIAVSYSGELAAKHARDCRAVIDSAWYRTAFPSTRLNPRKNTETEFETTRRGFRLATSPSGTLTGRGGNVIIIDDIMKPQEALSDARRSSTNSWYDNTLYSRLDNKSEDVIVVVMQRLHVDDFVAHLLDKEDWVILNLPAIAAEEQTIQIGEERYHVRKPGDLLHAGREPLPVLENIRRTIGSYDFSAQYQQNPVPPEGNLVKIAWFQRYDAAPERTSRSQIIQSWDTASKDGELNDYSVCTTWLVQDGDAWLLYLFRDRLDFPSLRRKAAELAARWKPDAVLIEDHVSGSALIQDLRTERLSLIPIRPEGDKVTRLGIASTRIEAGRVWLPQKAPWLDTFEMELLVFPNGKYDDQVDSMSQLLIWLRNREFNRAPLVEPGIVTTFGDYGAETGGVGTLF